MAEFELAADAASKVVDAPEPIRRTVERSEKPNPLLPALEASWAARTKRNGSDTETGATKQYRSYSPAETLAVVRALRRGSDKLNVGVRIVAPHRMVDRTNEDGTPVLDEDGNVKQRMEYRAGTVIFETHTRQQRARKATEDAEQDGEQDGENGEQDDTEAYEDAEQDGAEQESEQAPAWQ